MKKKNLFEMALFGCLVVVALAFAACSSDDDEKVSTYSYKIGFSALSETSSSSDTEGLTSSNIAKAYRDGIGVEKSTFTLTGTQSECDAKVVAGCVVAEKTLQGQVSKIDGTLKIENLSTNAVLRTVTFVKGETWN